METRNLYRDNERVVEAVFYNDKLLYTEIYFFDADLSVRGRVTVYSNGTVIISGDVDVIKGGD
jgi:hypothetical protein